MKKTHALWLPFLVSVGLAAAAVVGIGLMLTDGRGRPPERPVEAAVGFPDMSPLVITYTWARRALEAPEYSLPQGQLVAVVGSSDNYRIERRRDLSGGGADQSVLKVAGAERALGTSQAGDRNLSWSCSVMAATGPDLKLAGPASGGALFQQVKSIGVDPLLDMAEVDDLVATGWYRNAGTVTYLDRPARVLTASVESAPPGWLGMAEAVTVTLDAELGLRYAVEERAGATVTLYRAETRQETAPVDPSLFDVDLDDLPCLTMDVVVPFNHGQHPLVVSRALSVLDPLTTTLANGVSIERSVFVSTTWGTPLNEEGAWYVVHELEGTAGERLMMMQGDDSYKGEPADRLYPMWFSPLNAATATDWSAIEGYESVVPIALISGDDEYILTATTGLRERGIPFRYAVTWTFGAGLRAVLAGEWAVAEPEFMIETANVFIAAGSQ